VTLPGWTVYLTPPGIRLTMALWGIFFPMGLVFSLHDGSVTSAVRRGWLPLALTSLVLYLLAVLDVLGQIAAPLAGFVLPVVVIPLMMIVRREMIPGARSLERLGRNAYAIYLTNLILITLVLAGTLALAPSLYSVAIGLAALAGAVAIAVPTVVAAALERSPRPRLRLYVFG
jgi:peptidoglycan/LPS O-acetylase OafA/YrhL